MKFKFNENFVSHVPTECLVDDIQTLRLFLQTGDISAVECVIECLSESIDRYTAPADQFAFRTGLPIIKPSASSIVAMSAENGIITREDGTDIFCMAGKPVSFAMSGGILQCDKDCPYYMNGCAPDIDGILLEGNIRYDYDRNSDVMLSQLEEHEDPYECLSGVTEPTSVAIHFVNRNGEEDQTELDLYSKNKIHELKELWASLHEEMDADMDAIRSIDVYGCIRN